MKPTLCILAAGLSSRIYEKYGIHKCLLPVDNKPILAHLIESTPDSDIVIAVGFQQELIIDLCKSAYPDRNIKFVFVDKTSGPGTGPGYSLACCKPYLPEIFTVVVSDAYFPYKAIPHLTSSWIGITDVPDGTAYTSVTVSNGIATAVNPKGTSNKNIVVGAFGIHNNEFWDILQATKDEDVEFGFIAALDKYCKQYHTHIVRMSWRDVGNTAAYEELQSSNMVLAKTTKEYTYHCRNKCIKIFQDEKVVHQRVYRNNMLAGVVPPITYASKNLYAYDWIPGTTLYYVDDPPIVRLLNTCQKKLWSRSIQIDSFNVVCDKFYKDKTTQRLHKFLDNNPDINTERAYVINGKQYDSLSNYWKLIDWNNICDGIPVPFHGDLQFDNIVLRDDGELVLIDWRQDFAGGYYGDVYYDLSKLYGGLLLSYKNIRDNAYNFKMGDTIELNIRNLNSLVPRFEEWIADYCYNMDKIRVITALVYLSMAPLHVADFGKLLYFHAVKVLSDVFDR